MRPHIITTLGTYRADGIERKERRTRSRLLEQCLYSDGQVDNCLQIEPWDAYKRKSGASTYEQERLRAALDRLVGEYGRDFIGGAYVTYANRRYQVQIGHLASVNLGNVFRPVVTAITRLKRRYPGMLGVAIIEINARRNLSGEVVWNPHIHAALAGPNKTDVRAAFPKPEVAPGQHNKWLQVKEILDLEVLKYISKFECEMMVAYEGDDGKSRTIKNKSPPELEAEWLAFMASRPIRDFVRLIGFSAVEVQHFWSGEIAWPVGASRKRSI